MGKSVIIHNTIVSSSKSARTMTSLSGAEYHNHAMKIVGCDLHTQTDKMTTLKWHPSGHMRVETNKCYNAPKEEMHHLTHQEECALNKN